MPEQDTTTEVVKLNTYHLEKLGHLAGHEVSPLSEGLEVAKVENGLSIPLDGVYLGALIDRGGWNAGYRDKHVTPVTEAGIAFGVEQASYGYTGIFAKPMNGYSIESAKLDPETKEVIWSEETNTDGELKVTQDWGNLQDVDIFADPVEDLSNQGPRIGLIRVTGPDKSVCSFALAADFQGEPDKWQVRGGIVEVELKRVNELATPSSRAIEQ